MQEIKLTTEKDVRKTICEFLDKQGVFHFPNPQNVRGKYRTKKGKPDREGRFRGHPFWIEFKTLTGVLSDEQKDFIAKLEVQGDKVFVPHSFDQFYEEWKLWVRSL